jgi:hypothetical protein
MLPEYTRKRREIERRGGPLSMGGREHDQKRRLCRPKGPGEKGRDTGSKREKEARVTVGAGSAPLSKTARSEPAEALC